MRRSNEKLCSFTSSLLSVGLLAANLNQMCPLGLWWSSTATHVMSLEVVVWFRLVSTTSFDASVAYWLRSWTGNRRVASSKPRASMDEVPPTHLLPGRCSAAAPCSRGAGVPPCVCPHVCEPLCVHVFTGYTVRSKAEKNFPLKRDK